MRKCKNCGKRHDARHIGVKNRHLNGECIMVICNKCGEDISDSVFHECIVIVPSGVFPNAIGKKNDQDKIRMDLLPFDSLEEIAKVLTFGAKKYAPNNWKVVAHPIERYEAAMLRHISSYKNGEKLDSETGLPHLAHAACCLLFLISFEQKSK